jgi:hypothetical protein
VSLNKEDAIRVDWYLSDKSNRLRLYIFQCSCGNEIRSRPSYLHKHSGLCNVCNGKKTIGQAQIKNRLRPFEAKFNIFKVKCPETNLTYDDYLTFVDKNCHYCDRILPWQAFGENNPGFWLDRKDNNLGHTKGNLVVCCGVCNMTKRHEFSYQEFLLLAPTLKIIRQQRDREAVFERTSGLCEI